MSEPSGSPSSERTSPAGSPFDTDEIRTVKAPAAPEPAAASGGEGYDLEGGPLPDDEELPAPVPIPIPTRPTAKPKAKPKLEFERPDSEGTSEFADEESEVDEVWSRWGEWSTDLIRIGAVGLGTLFLAWLFGGNLTFAFFIFVLGMATMVALSYPVLITLERPVRITPEHAVSDFFAAASHHFPHYKRMWMLLSNQGRESGNFESFQQFRDHWKGRIDGWKLKKGVSKFTPLKFEVESFRVDKSSGKETSKADYTVAIYVRDRESEGPIETFRMSHGLVKGADRMWYMNRGVLGSRS